MFFLSSKRDIWRQERNLRVLFKKVRRECSSVETQKCSQPQAEQVVMFLIFKIIIVRVLMIGHSHLQDHHHRHQDHHHNFTIPGVCRCDTSVLPAWFGEILQQHGGFFLSTLSFLFPPPSSSSSSS